MKNTISMLFVFIGMSQSLICNAQNSNDLLHTSNSRVNKIIAENFKYNLKTSSLDLFYSSPDSIIWYNDSLENEPHYSYINEYSENKIISIQKYIENGSWINELKYEYYLDNTLPNLLFEPIFGGSSGSAEGYNYTYESSIGDTLFLKSSWDTLTESWIYDSKTLHFISNSGIDSLALTYVWDSSNQSWQLNNRTTQRYIQGTTDTIYFVLVSPDGQDTLKYDILGYQYDNTNRIMKIYDSWFGNLSIDSLTYTQNSYLEYEYRGDEQGYVYLYENRYDNKNRRVSTYFWDKQSGQPDWEFDGAINFYYPKEITPPTEMKVIDLEQIISIYPNPCTDQIYISGYKGSVTLRNIIGQIVMVENNLMPNTPINVSQLERGIYIIALQNGVTKKLIVN